MLSRNVKIGSECCKCTTQGSVNAGSPWPDPNQASGVGWLAGEERRRTSCASLASRIAVISLAIGWGAHPPLNRGYTNPRGHRGAFQSTTGDEPNANVVPPKLSRQAAGTSPGLRFQRSVLSYFRGFCPNLQGGVLIRS